jgi:tryptophan halogenase
LFPDRSFSPAVVAEFNRLAINEYERIRDFIVLHYKATTRDDAPLWNHCRNMDIPESLAYKIRQFRNSGRVIKYGGDLFAAPNWIAVLMGQEIWPQRHDPLTGQREAASVQQHLRQVRAAIRQVAEAAPRHEEYLAELRARVHAGDQRGRA